MKKFLTILSILFFEMSIAKAGILSPLADTFITVELSKSALSHKSINSDFKNQNDFVASLKQFDDIAFGGHLRIGKYLGFNLNWSQTSLKNDSLNGFQSLQDKAKYKSDQFNATTLLFLPIITKRAELFFEGGIVDIGSKLHYTPTGGAKVEKKSHQTMFLYGIGAQISPLGGDFIRLSAQRYAGKIGLLDANYTTFRIGYLKSF